MKCMPANRIAKDGTLRFAAAHLGLFCLPMYHKKDVRLKWVKAASRVKLSLDALDQIRIKPTLNYEFICGSVYTSCDIVRVLKLERV